MKKKRYAPIERDEDTRDVPLWQHLFFGAFAIGYCGMILWVIWMG